MEPLKTQTPRGDADEVRTARERYCVNDADGHEDPNLLKSVLAALQRAREQGATEWPAVQGVPLVKVRLDDPKQIRSLVERMLPQVESDPRLHAMSFVHPLMVARELGIGVSPRVARIVRRALAQAVSFDLKCLDESGRLRGFERIRWRLKAKTERT